MKIESVEVIPMAKESKWEDTPRVFEVSMITTDYVIWFTRTWDCFMSHGTEILKPEMDGACIEFAKRQQAFMLAPVAIFGNQVYAAKSKKADTLDGVVIDGPLYSVETYMTDDKSAGKTVERTYMDPETFVVQHGLWYPQKKAYKVRYGTIING